MKGNWFCGVLAIAALIVDPAWADSDKDIAWHACKAATLSQLGAVATAKFDNVSMPMIDGKLVVYFTVDIEDTYFDASSRRYGICLQENPGQWSSTLDNEVEVEVMDGAGGPDAYVPQN
jgi:hypothetical protein